MRLDHVSYAVSHNDWPTRCSGSARCWGTFVDGGRHPSFGTNNFVLPLTGGTYLEVVAALDDPAAEKAPFGARRPQPGGRRRRWMGWVISVEDIAVVEQRLGRPAADGRRVRPDGVG